MSQRVVTSFLNTNIPGAYPNIVVQSQPASLGASGIVVIMGEADGGDVFTDSAFQLKNNHFTPDQLDKVQQQYVSGPIVDAFRAFSAPSADADINGSANLIYIVKTNASTKAQATVDTDYATIKDNNFGTNGNLYRYQITSLQAETPPTLSGGTIPAFGAALNGDTFMIRLNGGSASTVTLSATPSDHADVASLVIELNSKLPAGITASAGTAPNSIALTMITNPSPYRSGWGRSFELVDSTPGDLAALGLAPGIQVAATETEVEVQLNRTDIGYSQTIDVATSFAMYIGYQGTTGTVTINQTSKMLTTTVVGGSGANLSISLAQYSTIGDLASFINSQTGYSCSADPAASQLPPSALDANTTTGIASTVAGGKPGRIKDAEYSFNLAANTASNVNFAMIAQAGLPNPMANPAFLTGGTKGGTSAATVINAINTLAGINVNIVVPLFSRDASADVTDGLTDASSTYTIDAIHAAVKAHCIQFSTPKLKKNRIAILSFWGDYNTTKQKSQGISQYRCSLAFQRPSQVNSKGVITSFLPWYEACVAAGMQAGGFYKAIVNKFANVISFLDPVGFDSGSPGDVEDALSAGLLFLTQDTAGARWVSDQTTYSQDTNFVYNSIQAVYASDILALDLAASFQSSFVGKSLADVDAATALSFLAQKMDGYKRLKLIAGSSDAPLGYKNQKVTINGPEMDVAVEIKLATAIYFIPISINISQVQSAA